MVMDTMVMVDKEVPAGTVRIWTSLKISKVKMTKRKKVSIQARTKRRMKCLSTIFIVTGWAVTKAKTMEHTLMLTESRHMERSKLILRQHKLMKPLTTQTIKMLRKIRKLTKKTRKTKRKKKKVRMMRRHPRSKPNSN